MVPDQLSVPKENAARLIQPAVPARNRSHKRQLREILLSYLKDQAVSDLGRRQEGVPEVSTIRKANSTDAQASDGVQVAAELAAEMAFLGTEGVEQGAEAEEARLKADCLAQDLRAFSTDQLVLEHGVDAAHGLLVDAPEGREGEDVELGEDPMETFLGEDGKVAQRLGGHPCT